MQGLYVSRRIKGQKYKTNIVTILSFLRLMYKKKIVENTKRNARWTSTLDPI